MLKQAIKNYFMAIVAVVMVVGFSAFRIAQPIASQAIVNFVYDTVSPIDEGDSWDLDELDPCEPGSELCGISFNTQTYPLDMDDKPNAFVLQQVLDNWSETPHGAQIEGTDITVYHRE